MKVVDEICHFRGSWVEVGGKDVKIVDTGKRGRTERENGEGMRGRRERKK